MLHALVRSLLTLPHIIPTHCFDDFTQVALLKTFSKDMEYLDEKLPPDILRFFQSVIEQAAALIIIKITAPWAILAAVPALVILLLIGRYYLRLERRARALESSSSKLIMAHVADTIDGAVTIRAYRKENYFSKEFHRSGFVQLSPPLPPPPPPILGDGASFHKLNPRKH